MDNNKRDDKPARASVEFSALLNLEAEEVVWDILKSNLLSILNVITTR